MFTLALKNISADTALTTYPLTPEKREEIGRVSEQHGWLKIQQEILEESNRVTHKDLAIIINSPEPKYLKSK